MKKSYLNFKKPINNVPQHKVVIFSLQNDLAKTLRLHIFKRKIFPFQTNVKMTLKGRKDPFGMEVMLGDGMLPDGMASEIIKAQCIRFTGS